MKNIITDFKKITFKQLFNLNGIFIALGFIEIIFCLGFRDIMWELGLYDLSDFMYYGWWIGVAMLLFVFTES